LTSRKWSKERRNKMSKEKKKFIKLRIDDEQDRANIILALVNNGYSVQVERETVYTRNNDIYWVIVGLKQND